MAYQENVAAVDTISADPRLIEQIEKLPPGEVFVVPRGGAIVFNRINQTRAVPVTRYRYRGARIPTPWTSELPTA